MLTRDQIIKDLQTVLRDYKLYGGLEFAREVRLIADILLEHQKTLDKR